MKAFTITLILLGLVSVSLALNCRVCGGQEGECQDAIDGGESKACPTDTEEQVCLYNEIHTPDTSMYVRRCEPKSAYGIQCKTESEGDDSALVCTCDSDNCNNVDECVYCAEPAPTSTSAPNPTPIMCQVCGDGTGICTDVNDNGQAKECPGETDVCLYSETYTGEKTDIIRRCEPKNVFGVHCKYESAGDVSSMICTCDSDNCNKDDGCTCQGPAPTSTSAPNPNPLMCQVCGDGLGECQDANDNGESKVCPGNTGEQVCLYSENHTGDESTFIRRCEPKSVFGVNCKSESEGDVSSVVCTCDSDNCNKDDGCTCQEPVWGLKCQQCDGDGGECSSPTDNGQSVTCGEDKDACWFQSLRNGDDETVYRSCINAGGLGDHCVDVDILGVGGTECFCTTENCNKDNLCECNTSSTIGLSMTLLASIFVMLTMK